MIVYDLGCGNSHRFAGWFSSPDDFENQQQGKLLSCPMCGDDRITKLPHASYVNTGAERPSKPPVMDKDQKAPSARGQHYVNLGDEMLTRIMDAIVENTEDVGSSFPEEARKIHYNEAPARHIRGTASSREVEALKDEGVEVVALPLPPHRLAKQH